MPEKKLRYILVPVGEEPYDFTSCLPLRLMQTMVVGLIEMVPVEHEGQRFMVVCNEEGKMHPEFKPNRKFFDDVIMGNFLIVAPPDDEGEMKSLTDAEYDAAISLLRNHMPKITGS